MALRSRTLALLSAVTLLAARQPGSAQKTPVFADSQKVLPATVSILALSSLAHTGFSGSEDIYLADISLKQGMHENAKLIDIYPATGNPIRRSLLIDRRQFSMRLIRTPYCDAPGRDVLQATRETNIFDTTTRSTFAGLPDEVVPCFKVMHDATRLSKK